MIKLFRSNFFILSIVLFIFSKELLSIDEEFLVSLCLILAFLVLYSVLRESTNNFVNSRTNSLLTIYSNFFSTQINYRNQFYIRLSYNLLSDIYFWAFVYKIKNDILFNFFSNYCLKKIFFNYFINEILISYLLYSYYLTNGAILAKCREFSNKSKNISKQSITLDFLKNKK